MTFRHTRFIGAAVVFVGSLFVMASTNALAWTQQKVTAPDPSPNAWYGLQTVISGDFAFVGAKNATVNGHVSQGAVYVYQKNGAGVWSLYQELIATDGAAGAGFGNAIAVRGDVAFITANLANVNGKTWAGCAYYFLHLGDHWVQVQKIWAKEPLAYGTFGNAVALNSGSVFISSGGSSSGGQYVPRRVFSFTPSIPGPFGNDWNGSQDFDSPRPTEVDSAAFGATIAASESVLMISARVATVNGNLGQGAVYTYAFDGLQWVRTDELRANDGGARDNFGVGLAVSDTVAMIGSPGATINGNIAQGAVYRFNLASGAWLQQQKIISNDGSAFNLLGSSVSLEGSLMLAGAYAQNDYTGSAYLYSLSRSGMWSQIHKFTASDGAPADTFGYSNAAALGGGVVLVGAFGSGANDTGAAYFYHQP